MKKRMMVDMDGVLGDVYTRFFELHKEETGIRKTHGEIVGLLEGEAYPSLARWAKTPGFFRTIPVMPDSQEVLKKLNEKYEVVIVSLATEFFISLTDKQLWIHDHFPYISWRQIVFCGNKNLIKADIMIDDHFKNLDSFEGETILFTQPHNLDQKDKSHKRVDTWHEIDKLLLNSK